MSETQLSSLTNLIKRTETSPNTVKTVKYRGSLQPIDCSMKKSFTASPDFSKFNKSAGLPPIKQSEIIKNEKDTIIKTNVLNITIKKSEEASPTTTYYDKKRKSIFARLISNNTKENEENEILKRIHSKLKEQTILENETESPLQNHYFKTIERYFPHFLREIIDKMNSPEETQEATSSLNSLQNLDKPMDFTLEDMKFLKETIMKEKSILEHEIKEVTLQKSSTIRMTFKDKYNKKWGKIRSTALAMGKMQALKNMVSKYGTSINLAGFSADKLEHFEEILKTKRKIHKRQKLLLSPYCNFMVFFWAPILIFLLIYISFALPYRTAFLKEENAMDMIIKILFFCDIVMNFFTIYEKEPILIDDHLKIIVKYLKTWFIIDILCLFPFDKIGCGMKCDFSSLYEDDLEEVWQFLAMPSTYKFLTLIRIIHISKTAHVKTFLNHFKDFLKLKTSSFRTIIFLIQVTICVHIVGCLWLYTAIVRAMAPYTWPKM